MKKSRDCEESTFFHGGCASSLGFSAAIALLACGSTSATSTAGGSHAGGNAGAAVASSGGSAGVASLGGSTGVAGAAGNANGGSGQVGTLGNDCATPGALACAQNYQKLQLVCGASHTWETNGTCSGGQFCDTSPGPNAGTCQDQDPACVGHEPGYVFCDGSSVMVCNADTTGTMLVRQCQGACVGAGNCDDTLPPCPTSTVIANCSDECGGPTANCAAASCPDFTQAIDLTGVQLTPGTVLVRTPNKPGVRCACDQNVPNGAPAAYAITFRNADMSHWVHVDAPWVVDGVQSACGQSAPPMFYNCVGLVTPASVRIYTNDPNAPSVNVTISDTCP